VNQCWRCFFVVQYSSLHNNGSNGFHWSSCGTILPTIVLWDAHPSRLYMVMSLIWEFWLSPRLLMLLFWEFLKTEKSIHKC
jgi:hypothetical protein